MARAERVWPDGWLLLVGLVLVAAFVSWAIVASAMHTSTNNNNPLCRAATADANAHRPDSAAEDACGNPNP